MRNISDHSQYIYCHVCPNKKVYTYLANKTQYNKCRFWTTGHARHFSLKNIFYHYRPMENIPVGPIINKLL
jgi:hypothetical protein